MTMRERAAEHGGALRIDSAPDGGTIIEADIPLNADGSA
jgi:signal transduction histidine kinase